jgi:hypothetical protein
MRKTLIALSLFITMGCSHNETASSSSITNDPLPSWNETPTKLAIADYVRKVTTPNSPDFIPVEDRIATFDNDGTLWAEQPPNEILFSESKAKEKNINHKPLDKMNQNEVLKFLYATHTGMTSETFADEVDNFFESTQHPTLNVSLKQTIYQPQVELIKLLMSNGFKVYICSGGTVDFIREVSQELYNVPKEQVIGTNFNYDYDENNNVLKRLPKIEFINDKKSKAYGIQKIIGKRPVFASGNVRSGGDIYMLRYSQGSKYPSFQLMINHDDAAREFAYDEKDNISLNWAQRFNWTVLSIKNDWKVIFPPAKKD